MKQTSLDAIRAALSTLLVELQKTDIPQEEHWVYGRRPDGGWQGTFVARPGTYSLIQPHEPLVGRLSNDLSPILTADYPDYMTKLVGLQGSGGGILQPSMILTVLAHESLKRFGTFAISKEQVDALLNDMTKYFDSPTIRIRLFAPVLNVHGSRDVPPMSLPDGIIMRPITDEECTLFYGGNPVFGTSRVLAFPDFVFVRELEARKVIFDSTKPVEEPFYKSTQEMLDRCILAISSFKDGGPVGYDGLRITAAELAFGIGFGGQHLWGNEHVPIGRYELTPDEAPRLEAYARLFKNIHPTLEMACQRLVDAARRTKPRDSIVDVVIGLESVLLVGGDKKEQGEKRFRFSLNYASLFPPSEREAAFYTARDLYDLRSQIAHGGEPKGKVKISGKEMTLHEIAPLARSVLRETLAKFMPNSSKPDFLAERYWMTRALGLGG
jgi:hypothetical protein